MPKIFISHSWEDNEISRNLATRLKNDGAEIWIDYARLSGGDCLPEIIGEAIEWCDTMVLLWSQSAAKSYYVKLEWSTALSNKKRIIPCLIERIRLPIILSSFLYIDICRFPDNYYEVKRALNISNQAFPSIQPSALYGSDNTLKNINVLNDGSNKPRPLREKKASMVEPLVSTAEKDVEQSHLSRWKRFVDQMNINLDFDVADAEYFYKKGLSCGKDERWEKMVFNFCQSFSISNKFEIFIRNELDRYWVANFNIGVKKITSKYNCRVEDSGAIKQFIICTIIDPTRIDAYRNIAVCYLRSNNFSAAKESYMKLLAVEPKNATALNEVSRLCLQMKDISCAIEMAQKAVELNPANPEAVINLALAYDMNGESEKAISQYTIALEKNPNDSDLIFNLARLYFNKAEFNKAVGLFKMVVSQNPDDYDANVNVGNAYLNMAENARKKLVEKEKAEIEIDDEEMINLKKLYTEAIPYIENALHVKSDNKTVWYNLGVAYVNVGNTDKGKQCFDMAESLIG